MSKESSYIYKILFLFSILIDAELISVVPLNGIAPSGVVNLKKVIFSK
jgi:hypothetical protein